MSFADKVAALRDFFLTPSDAALPLQVAMMNEQMGIDGEGALPKQVDALCRTCFGSAWQPSPAVQPEGVAIGVAIGRQSRTA